VIEFIFNTESEEIDDDLVEFILIPEDSNDVYR
jgi:hypothetical protein